MHVFDYYGLREADLAPHLPGLADLLGVQWDRRDSSYFGQYAKASAAAYGGGTFKVQPNDLRDEDGPYLLKPQYPEHRFLLSVNRCPEADRVRALLATAPEWEFLHRSVVE